MAISAMGRRLMRDVGTPEDIYQSLRAFRKDLTALSEQRNKLTEKYPNKWIAFYEGEVVSVATTTEELLNAVERDGLPRDKVVTQFLGTEKITMVL